MKFKSDRKVMPELVASKDAFRPALTNVHLDVDKAQVVVTDSYMLARFPVELDEGDTSGPIPVDALKASRRPPSKFGDVAIRVGEAAQVEHNGSAYLTVPRGSSDYQFPNADQLIPDTLSEFRIGLNAEKLHALSKALGCGNDDAVELRFVAGVDGEPLPLRPVLVRPARHGDGDGDAILMPVRLSS